MKQSKTLALILILILVVGIVWKWLSQEPQLTKVLEANASGSSPITGTFLVPKGVLTTQAGLEAFFPEIKQNNIDTLIITAIGHISKKADGSYTKVRTISDSVVTSIFRLAKQYGIKVYWGTTGSDWSEHSVIRSGGGPDTPAADEKALVDYSSELLGVLKQDAVSAGVSWSDATVAGLYIHFEPLLIWILDPNSYSLDYLSHHAQSLKTSEPAKKIIFSPLFYDSDTYNSVKTAYTNLLRAAPIDIAAPQDTMGAGAVTTFAESAENFRALHDAVAQFPGREAWANVESYENHAYVRYPPTISRFSQQISAVQPYVSKIITFVYQNSLLVNPIFDSLYNDGGPNPAAERKKFYQDFTEYYSLLPTCGSLYYYNTQNNTCVKTAVFYGLASHKQCGLLNPPTCEANLNTVLPGKTTGICYQSLSACQAATASPSPSPTLQPSPSSTPTPPASVPPTPTPSQGPVPSVSPTANSADLNSDNKVDIFDYNILLTDFGKTGAAGWIKADIDKNGEVDIFDYNLLVTGFGK